MNVLIVNEKDEVVGVKSRDEKLPIDIGRVASLIVYNSKGEILLSQRVFTKKHAPGKWDLACAGTVEEGETYISNIIKEAEEELGLIIKESDLRVVSHTYEETSHRYFVTIFATEINKDISEFKIQKTEVEAIKWVSIPELVNWFQNSPDDFVASLKKRFELLHWNQADTGHFLTVFSAFK